MSVIQGRITWKRLKQSMKNFDLSVPPIPIIYFHSVGPKNPRWVRNFLTLELEYFEAQLKIFSEYFKVISLYDYWEILNGRRQHIKNSIVITFDDGYLDNWLWAFPLLKKYNFPATIFVSPEFVDANAGARPIKRDFNPNRTNCNELETGGYLSWEEMKIMENSGLIDIQSHTLTHTKYFVSDIIIGFHHPGDDCLYPVGNLFPDWKPFSISNSKFEKLIPYGYPFFEEKSAITANRVWINDNFNNEIIEALRKYDFNKYDFNTVNNSIQSIYSDYKKRNLIIIKTESAKEYKERIANEIFMSRYLIDKNLKKETKFICWPHGDSNEFAHRKAIESGYLASTLGSYKGEYNPGERIETRIGINSFKNSRLLTKLKSIYKIYSAMHRNPYYFVNQVYEGLKYR